MKKRSEIDDKAVKNQTEMIPKATKICLGAPQSGLGDPRVVMEASRKRLGGVLGADRVNSCFFEDVSNEITILAKNGDFVRE